MMRGYWNDPEQTAAAIDDDGWLRTGDLGWVGDDGNLRLAGRTQRDVHPRRQQRVSDRGRELPRRPSRRWPRRRCSGPTSTTGSARSACCSPCPGRGFAVELDDVRSFVAERLAGYKAPDCLVLVEALPLTTIGKVDKLALRERADEEAAHWRRVPT